MAFSAAHRDCADKRLDRLLLNRVLISRVSVCIQLLLWCRYGFPEWKGLIHCLLSGLFILKAEETEFLQPKAIG